VISVTKDHKRMAMTECQKLKEKRNRLN